MSVEADRTTDLAHEDVEDPGGDGQWEVGEEDGEEPGGRVHGGVETLGLEVDMELREVLLGRTKESMKKLPVQMAQSPSIDYRGRGIDGPYYSK